MTKGLSINFRSTSDGWRGKLADNFIFSNVYKLSSAISTYLLRDLQENRILLGYDTRFMSEEFAKYMADTFSDFGINAIIIENYCPTPLLTFSTKKYGFPIGLNITASHNSPYDNGIKIRMPYGGTPHNDVIKHIETYLKSPVKNSGKKIDKGRISTIDPRKDYFSHIRSQIEIKEHGAKSKTLIDSMYGTTSNLLKEALVGIRNLKVDYIHNSVDPYFGGINPEPKYESTTELQKIIKKGEYDVGIAHDGDGDRIVAVLPSIGYLSPHDVSALLVLYLGKYKKMKGKVIGSSTLGRKIKRVSKNLGLEFQEIPVGFKNATDIMLNEDVLLAAEENGGIGFGFNMPERDATLAAAILIEAEHNVKGGLKKLYREVEKLAGSSGFCRFNYEPKNDRFELFKKIVKNNGSCFDFGQTEEVGLMDGIKINFQNGDWLSIRLSGTEDILRIYCESDSRKKAVELKNYTLKKIKELQKIK
ncbi:hypothetical protein KKB40_06400 [Patescibacteria group bacterium]|nr:hypothetical protein [Patescibacteria group bacterium]